MKLFSSLLLPFSLLKKGKAKSPTTKMFCVSLLLLLVLITIIINCCSSSLKFLSFVEAFDPTLTQTNCVDGKMHLSEMPGKTAGTLILAAISNCDIRVQIKKPLAVGGSLLGIAATNLVNCNLTISVHPEDEGRLNTGQIQVLDSSFDVLNISRVTYIRNPCLNCHYHSQSLLAFNVSQNMLNGVTVNTLVMEDVKVGGWYTAMTDADYEGKLRELRLFGLFAHPSIQGITFNNVVIQNNLFESGPDNELENVNYGLEVAHLVQIEANIVTFHSLDISNNNMSLRPGVDLSSSPRTVSPSWSLFSFSSTAVTGGAFRFSNQFSITDNNADFNLSSTSHHFTNCLSKIGGVYLVAGDLASLASSFSSTPMTFARNKVNILLQFASARCVQNTFVTIIETGLHATKKWFLLDSNEFVVDVKSQALANNLPLFSNLENFFYFTTYNRNTQSKNAVTVELKNNKFLFASVVDNYFSDLSYNNFSFVAVSDVPVSSLIADNNEFRVNKSLAVKMSSDTGLILDFVFFSVSDIATIGVQLPLVLSQNTAELTFATGTTAKRSLLKSYLFSFTLSEQHVNMAQFGTVNLTNNNLTTTRLPPFRLSGGTTTEPTVTNTSLFYVAAFRFFERTDSFRTSLIIRNWLVFQNCHLVLDVPLAINSHTSRASLITWDAEATLPSSKFSIVSSSVSFDLRKNMEDGASSETLTQVSNLLFVDLVVFLQRTGIMKRICPLDPPCYPVLLEFIDNKVNAAFYSMNANFMSQVVFSAYMFRQVGSEFGMTLYQEPALFLLQRNQLKVEVLYNVVTELPSKAATGINGGLLSLYRVTSQVGIDASNNIVELADNATKDQINEFSFIRLWESTPVYTVSVTNNVFLVTRTSSALHGTSRLAENQIPGLSGQSSPKTRAVTFLRLDMTRLPETESARRVDAGVPMSFYVSGGVRIEGNNVSVHWSGTGSGKNSARYNLDFFGLKAPAQTHIHVIFSSSSDSSRDGGDSVSNKNNNLFVIKNNVFNASGTGCLAPRFSIIGLDMPVGWEYTSGTRLTSSLAFQKDFLFQNNTLLANLDLSSCAKSSVHPISFCSLVGGEIENEEVKFALQANNNSQVLVQNNFLNVSVSYPKKDDVVVVGQFENIFAFQKTSFSNGLTVSQNRLFYKISPQDRSDALGFVNVDSQNANGDNRMVLLLRLQNSGNITKFVKIEENVIVADIESYFPAFEVSAIFAHLKYAETTSMRWNRYFDLEESFVVRKNSFTTSSSASSSSSSSLKSYPIARLYFLRTIGSIRLLENSSVDNNNNNNNNKRRFELSENFVNIPFYQFSADWKRGNTLIHSLFLFSASSLLNAIESRKAPLILDKNTLLRPMIENTSYATVGFVSKMHTCGESAMILINMLDVLSFSVTSNVLDVVVDSCFFLMYYTRDDYPSALRFIDISKNSVNFTAAKREGASFAQKQANVVPMERKVSIFFAVQTLTKYDESLTTISFTQNRLFYVSQPNVFAKHKFFSGCAPPAAVRSLNFSHNFMSLGVTDGYTNATLLELSECDPVSGVSHVLNPFLARNELKIFSGIRFGHHRGDQQSITTAKPIGKRQPCEVILFKFQLTFSCPTLTLEHNAALLYGLTNYFSQLVLFYSVQQSFSVQQIILLRNWLYFDVGCAGKMYFLDFQHSSVAAVQMTMTKNALMRQDESSFERASLIKMLGATFENQDGSIWRGGSGVVPSYLAGLNSVYLDSNYANTSSRTLVDKHARLSSSAGSGNQPWQFRCNRGFNVIFRAVAKDDPKTSWTGALTANKLYCSRTVTLSRTRTIPPPTRTKTHNLTGSQELSESETLEETETRTGSQTRVPTPSKTRKRSKSESPTASDNLTVSPDGSISHEVSDSPSRGSASLSGSSSLSESRHHDSQTPEATGTRSRRTPSPSVSLTETIHHPVEKTVVRQVTEGMQAGFVVVSALSIPAASVSFGMGRQQSITQLLDGAQREFCGFTYEQGPLPFSQSPTRLEIVSAGEQYKYAAGAVVGNIVLTFGFFLLFSTTGFCYFLYHGESLPLLPLAVKTHLSLIFLVFASLLFGSTLYHGVSLFFAEHIKDEILILCGCLGLVYVVFIAWYLNKTLNNRELWKCVVFEFEDESSVPKTEAEEEEEKLNKVKEHRLSQAAKAQEERDMKKKKRREDEMALLGVGLLDEDGDGKQKNKKKDKNASSSSPAAATSSEIVIAGEDDDNNDKSNDENNNNNNSTPTKNDSSSSKKKQEQQGKGIEESESDIDDFIDSYIQKSFTPCEACCFRARSIVKFWLDDIGTWKYTANTSDREMRLLFHFALPIMESYIANAPRFMLFEFALQTALVGAVIVGEVITPERSCKAQGMIAVMAISAFLGAVLYLKPIQPRIALYTVIFCTGLEVACALLATVVDPGAALLGHLGIVQLVAQTIFCIVMLCWFVNRVYQSVTRQRLVMREVPDSDGNNAMLVSRLDLKDKRRISVSNLMDRSFFDRGMANEHASLDSDDGDDDKNAEGAGGKKKKNSSSSKKANFKKPPKPVSFSLSSYDPPATTNLEVEDDEEATELLSIDKKKRQQQQREEQNHSPASPVSSSSRPRGDSLSSNISGIDMSSSVPPPPPPPPPTSASADVSQFLQPQLFKPFEDEFAGTNFSPRNSNNNNNNINFGSTVSQSQQQQQQQQEAAKKQKNVPPRSAFDEIDEQLRTAHLQAEASTARFAIHNDDEDEEATALADLERVELLKKRLDQEFEY